MPPHQRLESRRLTATGPRHQGGVGYLDDFLRHPALPLRARAAAVRYQDTCPKRNVS